jgi:predicted kinase
MTEFIMLVGLPGSGKSTYASSLLKETPNCVYLSSDKIREELYGDESIQGDATKVFNTLHNRVCSALTNNQSVIYDATNVNRKSRRGILNRISGFTVNKSAHIVWAPYEECVQRDSNRHRTVGEEVIHKFIYRWETPYYDEGFGTIVLVHNVGSEFDVKEYHEKMITSMDIPHENPHHSLGVLDHCLCAYSMAFAESNDKVVIEASRLHDIGKPMTKFYAKDDDGNALPHAHYYNHHNVGGYLVLGCFDRKASEFAIDVSWLITNHMEPFFNSSYYNKLDGLLKSRIDTLHKFDLNSH